MLGPEELDALARSLRRERVLATATPEQRRKWTRADLEGFIPHRGPMLLLDGVDAIDLAGARLRATREIAADALGLDGHFPGAPLYPGVLQMEMVGQAGLCLAYHLQGAAEPIPARVVRVHHASFLGPVRPGERLTIEVRRVEDDALTGTVAGQVCVGGEIRSTCVLEVYFVDAA